MQNSRIWQRACRLTRTVIEGVRIDDNADAIIVSVRPDARARSRCGVRDRVPRTPHRPCINRPRQPSTTTPRPNLTHG